MKLTFWLLACCLTVISIQYGLFKENGEPRQLLPVAVVR